MKVGFTCLLVVCLFAGVQLAAVRSGCPSGEPKDDCFVDPCLVASHKGCNGFPDAHCVANYCGGCYAEWYDADDKLLVCH